MKSLDELLNYVDVATKCLVDKVTLLRAEQEQYEMLEELIGMKV